QMGARKGQMGRLPVTGQGAEASRAQELALHGRLHDQGRPSAAGRIRQDCSLIRIGPKMASPARRALLSFARPAIVAAALFLPAGASAQVPFTSAQGGYFVSFPAEPRETVETKPEGKIFSYIVRQNDAVYGSSHVDYNSDLDVEQELQANALNFADAVKAPVTSRRRAEVTAGTGAKLPELEFTYESDKLAGKGIVVVSGRRSILVTAFA